MTRYVQPAWLAVFLCPDPICNMTASYAGQADSQVDASFGFAFKVWLPTCVDLYRCVDFGRAQIWTQVGASFLPFGHPAQVDASWSQVICCYKNALTTDMRKIDGFLRLASRLANPFGHPLQVRAQVLVLQTCIDLRVRLARALGGGWGIFGTEEGRGLWVKLSRFQSGFFFIALLIYIYIFFCANCGENGKH